VVGGDTRQKSVLLGLREIKSGFVAIHDGARPFVSPKKIDEAVQCARQYGAAALGVPVTDTLKRTGAHEFIKETVSREKLWQIQTPQVFDANTVLLAHIRAETTGFEVTDDCLLMENAGVAVKMMYASGASGAYTSDSRTALVNTFSYSNAVYSGYSSSGILLATLYKMVNPNLDAGYPVMLGIDGNAGHAILADGYGYNASTLYHHLNMGWAGASDAWYNLPIINTDVGYYFNVVDECVYNVYPSGTGEIISGRVTTPAGIPLAGLTITAERTGGGTYTATTTSQGIYALPKIPANSTYTIHVAGSNYRFASRTANTTTSTNATVNCGNYWGADFQGRHPADFNGDNVVDGADISFLLSCFTGPEGSVTNNCQATDLNNDSVVDMEDFAILQRCLAPTPELLDPDCVDEWR